MFEVCESWINITNIVSEKLMTAAKIPQKKLYTT